MNIEETASKLHLSTRQVRRLVSTGVLPASKATKLVEISYWNVDDAAVQLVDDLWLDWRRSELAIGPWAVQQAVKLDIPFWELSRLARVKAGRAKSLAVLPEESIDQLEAAEDGSAALAVFLAVVRARIRR